MKTLLSIFFTIGSFMLLAQNDSSLVLEFSEFMERVRTQHPMAEQARLKTEMARAGIRNARGAFDPKLQADVAQKYFKDTEYYDLGEGKLKVPTWFGIELEGGIERNEGTYLNPENKTPDNGLWFAGISVPVGKGLFVDERRTELRKAQAMFDLSIAEQDILLNDLLYEAGVAYWEWFNAYYVYRTYEEAIVLAKERFQAVKRGAELGDLPFIDTLEASIQLQNRQLSFQEAELELKNKSAGLAVYLWEEGLIPLELGEQTRPEDADKIRLQIAPASTLLFNDSLLNNHPEIQKNRAKQQQLKFEERWNREQLKPELNLKYKPITEVTGDNPFAEYSVNNYTWGLQFEFPLFLRKERGKLKLTQLKLSENEFLLSNKQQQLRAKLTMALNDYETTNNQVLLSYKNFNDYGQLLNGERRLFLNGESSLFLVNSRELGYISSEIKLINTISKNQKSILKIKYALANF